MAKQPVQGKKKELSWTSISIFVIIICLVIVAMPTVILLLFGLLPTLAALLTDKSYNRSATFCVGALNFAGLFPFLYDLWAGANTMADAVQMLASVFSLVIIYGAAAFGWMVFNSIPPIIGSFLTVVNERQMKILKKTQLRLIKEWGEEVTSSGLPGSGTSDKEKEKEKSKDEAPPPPAPPPEGSKTNA